MSRKLFSFLLCFFFLFITPQSVYAAQEVYLGGDSIGIKAEYDGVMITGTYSFQANGKTYDPSSTFLLGDVIIQCKGEVISNLEQLYAILSSLQNTENTVEVKIKRNDKIIDKQLVTVYDEKKNNFQSGLYVKDSITGVGTLTYIDPGTMKYGALGHEITDADLKKIAPIQSGSIYDSRVTSIQKAQKDVPGQKHAAIDYTKQIGDVNTNTPIGIYGNYFGNKEHSLIPCASKEEIVLGEAYFYTVIDGNTVEPFKIEITKLHSQKESDIKGIEFRIEDERLKQKTNGIVQGMSGSPIVQNGKLIGAVTHVITSDPMKGYGVYIDWMLENTKQ